ncbi:MAG: sugar isomerase domain-containing protein [Actinocrinis sp.]
MPIDTASFLGKVREQLDRIEATQAGAIDRAADLIAAALAEDGVLQVFGTGHSEALAMELVGRAGGLIPTNKLALRDLVILGGESAETLADPKAERDPALARRVWDLAPIGPHDPVVIASQSGGNGSTVEMARIARENGHPLIAVTSREHSERIVSRHPSGKRLFELADVVIDNAAPYGDAVLDLPGGGTVCGVSSIGNAVIAQLLVAAVTARLIAADADAEPPIYLSANIAEGDAHNDVWEARYAGRIRRSAY